MLLKQRCKKDTPNGNLFDQDALMPDERKNCPTNVVLSWRLSGGGPRRLSLASSPWDKKNRPAEPGGKNFFQGQLLHGFYPKDLDVDFSGLDYWLAFRIWIGLLRLDLDLDGLVFLDLD